jgi:hypothetical protein
MPKAILAADTNAPTSTGLQDVPDDQFTSRSSSLAICLSGPTQHASNGQFEAGARTGSIGRTPDQIEQSPDYPARLRAAFQGLSEQALVSREDAMGAAAEIEQLWAMFWILVGFPNGNTPPRDQTMMPVATAQYQLFDQPDEQFPGASWVRHALPSVGMKLLSAAYQRSLR